MTIEPRPITSPEYLRSSGEDRSRRRAARMRACCPSTGATDPREERTIMSRLFRQALFVVVSLAFASAAYAQASITGVVRDASGAVLPGVTVEASSPALIE